MFAGVRGTPALHHYMITKPLPQPTVFLGVFITSAPENRYTAHCTLKGSQRGYGNSPADAYYDFLEKNQHIEKFYRLLQGPRSLS